MITTIPQFIVNSISPIPGNYTNQKIISFYSEYLQYRSDVKIVDSIIRSIISTMNLPIPTKMVDITFGNEYEYDGTEKIDAFSSKPNHRDHFIHSLNVYSLGTALYETSTTIQDLFKTCQQKPDWWQCWAFASLFHDIGYFCNIDDPIIKGNALDKIWEYLLDGRIQRSLFDHNYRGENDYCKGQKLDPILSEDRIKEIICKKNPDKNQLTAVIKPKSLWNRVVGLTFRKEPHLIAKLFESDVDHGLASEKLINLLNEIQSILNLPEFKYELESEGLGFERGFLADYISQIEAIKYHGKHIADVTKDLLSRNPWIGYLHIIDELQTYDRPKLNEKYAQFNKTEEISIEMPSAENDPILFHYPDDCLPRIAGNVQDFQRQLLIEIKSK